MSQRGAWLRDNAPSLVPDATRAATCSPRTPVGLHWFGALLLGMLVREDAVIFLAAMQCMLSMTSLERTALAPRMKAGTPLTCGPPSFQTFASFAQRFKRCATGSPAEA